MSKRKADEDPNLGEQTKSNPMASEAGQISAVPRRTVAKKRAQAAGSAPSVDQSGTNRANTQGKSNASDHATVEQRPTCSASTRAGSAEVQSRQVEGPNAPRGLRNPIYLYQEDGTENMVIASHVINVQPGYKTVANWNDATRVIRNDELVLIDYIPRGTRVNFHNTYASEPKTGRLATDYTGGPPLELQIEFAYPARTPASPARVSFPKADILAIAGLSYTVEVVTQAVDHLQELDIDAYDEDDSPHQPGSSSSQINTKRRRQCFWWSGPPRTCSICKYRRSRLNKLRFCGHKMCRSCCIKWPASCPYCRSAY